jgi:hypothetical protein
MVSHRPRPAAGGVALAHFLTLRTTGCFAPVPELWSVLHLVPYRDDPGSGDDPFAHYLDDMQRLQCEPFLDLPVIMASGLIDPRYHLINGIDMRAAALDATEHFCRLGWRKGRKPNTHFDVHRYLCQRYSDSGLKPSV